MNQIDSRRSAQIATFLACTVISCISLAVAPQELSAQATERKGTELEATPPDVIQVGWCGSRTVPQAIGDGIAGQASDCGPLTNPPNIATNPYPSGDPYAPTAVKYRIPVVFHVVHNGPTEFPGGKLSVARVQSQIMQINNDFLSAPSGIDVRIEFYLNTAVDGDGIMYHDNATWFTDPIAWSAATVDAHNNLNIFSYDMPAGLAGQASIPQGGCSSCAPVGSAGDVVRLDYLYVGNPSLSGSPYHQGRVATHEIGHYLGLYHTFESALPPFGCTSDTSPACYTVGDALCDTPSQLPPSATTCEFSDSCPTGGPDLVNNYMNYTPPTCFATFTAEQVRRARCTLINWRPQLGEPLYTCPTPPVFTGNFTSTPLTLISHVSSSSSTLFTPAQTCPPGLTNGAGQNPYFYAGSQYAQIGNEVAYKILHGGGDLRVDLTNLSTDLDLFLLGAAGTPASTLALSEISGIVNESVFLAAASPGVYYAVVETYDPLDAGSFSLTYRGTPVGYNVDINAGIQGFDQPTPIFGAAADQPGTWTLLTGDSDLSENLAVANGFVTSASITRNNAVGGAFIADNPNTSGDFQWLLDDIQDAPAGTTYTFSNLVPGNYRVFTYAIAPDSAVYETIVSVAGSPDPAAVVGGPMPVNAFALNDTHSVHRFAVAAGGTIQVTVNAVPGSYISVNGFQIKPQPVCAQDVNGNGLVNIEDLLAVVASWGNCPSPCPPHCAADVDQNCFVNIADLLAVISAWGNCP